MPLPLRPLSGRLKTRLLDYARVKAPHEACGLLWLSGQRWHFRPMENLAADPCAHFRMDGAALLAHSHHPFLSVFHSHPGGPAYPSFEDMRYQMACGLPYLILSLERPEGVFFWLGANQAYPLYARPYRHGVTDCYGLIRDWYARKRQIQLPDYPREWNWWHRGQDYFAAYFKEAGFVPLPDNSPPQTGDVALFTIRSPVCNHAGINIGQGRFLHHAAGAAGFDEHRLPKTDLLRRWQPFLHLWLRWKG